MKYIAYRTMFSKGKITEKEYAMGINKEAVLEIAKDIVPDNLHHTIKIKKGQ